MMKKVSKLVLFSAGLLLAGSVLAGDLRVKFNVATGAERAWTAQNKGRLILTRLGEPTMFKPKPGYGVVGDTEVKESVSLSLHGAGSYKIMWNVTGKDPQEVGAFEYTGEGDQDITITYDGAGVSVTDFGSLRPVMKEDAVTAVPPAGLTEAQIRQQELAASRAKGGTAARVAEEAALKKAQEDQTREEARKRLEAQKRDLERQRAAEEARAAAAEQAKKDEEAASMSGAASMSEAATKIQFKARQRAATKKVTAMRAAKTAVEMARRESEPAAREEVVAGGGSAGAASGGDSPAHTETHFSLMIGFDEYAQDAGYAKLDKGEPLGTVQYTTLAGEEKSLPISAATVDLVNLDNTKPVNIRLQDNTPEGHRQESGLNASYIIGPSMSVLSITLKAGAGNPFLIAADSQSRVQSTGVDGEGVGAASTTVEPVAGAGRGDSHAAVSHSLNVEIDVKDDRFNMGRRQRYVIYSLTGDSSQHSLALKENTTTLPSNLDRTRPIVVQISGYMGESIKVSPTAYEVVVGTQTNAGGVTTLTLKEELTPSKRS